MSTMRSAGRLETPRQIEWLPSPLPGESLSIMTGLNECLKLWKVGAPVAPLSHWHRPRDQLVSLPYLAPARCHVTVESVTGEDEM